MALRIRELRPVNVIADLVVPEPILAGLETLNYLVARLNCVCGGMPVERIVAAADMATRSTASEVEPPGVVRFALHTPGPAGGDGWIDHLLRDRHATSSVENGSVGDSRMTQSPRLFSPVLQSASAVTTITSIRCVVGQPTRT